MGEATGIANLGEPQVRVLTVPEFFPDARAMRAEYDAFFDDPYAHDGRHAIFDYWHVPDHYTYLRTLAERLFSAPLMHRFWDHAQRWAVRELGLTTVTNPFLGIYVNGCRQELHNDAINGVYGYVLSLTDWDRRTFTGGETLLAKEGVVDAREPRRKRRVNDYFDRYPASFNQLLVFDDRLPHAVAVVQGSMDPRQARVVLHGHIY